MRLIGLALGTSLAHAQSPAYTIDNWAAECDNTRHCGALGVQADDDRNVLALLVSRDAGPSAQVLLLVSAVREPPIVAGPVVDLHIGELHLKLRNGPPGEPTEVLTAGQLSQLRAAATRASGSAEVSDGQHRWSLALEAMRPVLRWVDDQQGRAGTPGALVARADIAARPEGAVSPPASAPVIQRVPVETARTEDAGLAEPIARAVTPGEGCDVEPDSRSVARLAPHQVMLLVRCTGGGRNEPHLVAWISDDRAPYAPKKLRLSTGKATDTANAQDLFSDYADGVLSFRRTSLYLECRVTREWIWTGSDFALAAVRTQPFCAEPEDGPSLRSFTARVVGPAARP